MCVFDAVSHRGVGQGVFVSVCVLQPVIDEEVKVHLCVCVLDVVSYRGGGQGVCLKFVFVFHFIFQNNTEMNMALNMRSMD